MGTWFIGRLQTTQDVDRVIDGLGGQVGSSYDKAEIRSLLSNMKKRTFFLKSAHLDDIRLFGTRWVMSYLKGPLKRDEISVLMKDQKTQLSDESDTAAPVQKIIDVEGFETFTSLHDSIPQYFMPNLAPSKQYVATLMADCTLNFFNQSRGIDEEENYCLSLDVDVSDRHANWDLASNDKDAGSCLGTLPAREPESARYAETPKYLDKDRALKATSKSLSDWLYHEHVLELYRCKSPKLESEPYETRGDFKIRVSDALNDEKEKAIEKLQERYGKKEKVLLDRLNRYQLSVDKEQADSTSSYMNVGITLLGALFGSSKASVGRAGSRILKERGDMGRAQERVARVEDDLRALGDELEDKIDNLVDEFDIENIDIDDFQIKPRRSDIQIKDIAVVWKPL